MTIANRSRILFAAACLSAGAAFAPHALAQDTTQPAEQPAVQAPDVSEEKLQSFVVALAEVDRVKQEYTQRLQQAESPEQQQQLQTEAGQRMLQAVEEADGISVNEYNQIIQAAQNDPALAQRLTNLITPEADAAQ